MKETPDLMLMNHLDELAALEPTTIDSDTEPSLMPADLLVTLARQTGARVTFIEDTALLSSVGGVGAMLRYHI